jgi:hypothetical protein
MVNQSTNERLTRSIWARLVAIALFTVAVGELAVIAHPYEHLDIPRVGPQTDHGWPLPAVRVTHDDSSDGLLLPERVLHRVHAVANIGILPGGLLYDLAVICLSFGAIWIWYIPWRAFPRPQVSLVEVCIMLAFLTTGCVLASRMWTAGTELWQTSKFVLIANTASYLVITVVYAGAVNGALAARRRPLQLRPPFACASQANAGGR